MALSMQDNNSRVNALVNDIGNRKLDLKSTLDMAAASSRRSSNTPSVRFDSNSTLGRLNTNNKLMRVNKRKAEAEMNKLNWDFQDPQSKYYKPYYLGENAGKDGDEDFTAGMEQDLTALHSTVQSLVNKGYSDQDIVNRVKTSDFAYLKQADDEQGAGVPHRTTRAVNYIGSDTVYSAIQQARSGSKMGDSLMNLGEYSKSKSSAPDKYSEASYDPQSEWYNPYGHGSTNNGKETPDRVARNTEDAKRELRELREWSDKLLERGYSADEIISMLGSKEEGNSETYLANNFPTLDAMETYRQSGTALELDDEVDFALPYFRAELKEKENPTEEKQGETPQQEWQGSESWYDKYYTPNEAEAAIASWLSGRDNQAAEEFFTAYSELTSAGNYKYESNYGAEADKHTVGSLQYTWYKFKEWDENKANLTNKDYIQNDRLGDMPHRDILNPLNELAKDGSISNTFIAQFMTELAGLIDYADSNGTKVEDLYNAGDERVVTSIDDMKRRVELEQAYAVTNAEDMRLQSGNDYGRIMNMRLRGEELSEADSLIYNDIQRTPINDDLRKDKTYTQAIDNLSSYALDRIRSNGIGGEGTPSDEWAANAVSTYAKSYYDDILKYASRLGVSFDAALQYMDLDVDSLAQNAIDYAAKEYTDAYRTAVGGMANLFGGEDADIDASRNFRENAYNTLNSKLNNLLATDDDEGLNVDQKIAREILGIEPEELAEMGNADLTQMIRDKYGYTGNDKITRHNYERHGMTEDEYEAYQLYADYQNTLDTYSEGNEAQQEAIRDAAYSQDYSGFEAKYAQQKSEEADKERESYLAGEDTNTDTLNLGKDKWYTPAYAIGTGVGKGVLIHATSYVDAYRAIVRGDWASIEKGYRETYTPQELRQAMVNSINTIPYDKMRNALLADLDAYNGDIYKYRYDMNTEGVQNVLAYLNGITEVYDDAVIQNMGSNGYEWYTGAANATNSTLAGAEATLIASLTGGMGASPLLAQFIGGAATYGVQEFGETANAVLDRGGTKAESILRGSAQALAITAMEVCLDGDTKNMMTQNGVISSQFQQNYTAQKVGQWLLNKGHTKLATPVVRTLSFLSNAGRNYVKNTISEVAQEEAEDVVGAVIQGVGNESIGEIASDIFDLRARWQTAKGTALSTTLTQGAMGLRRTVGRSRSNVTAQNRAVQNETTYALAENKSNYNNLLSELQDMTDEQFAEYVAENNINDLADVADAFLEITDDYNYNLEIEQRAIDYAYDDFVALNENEKAQLNDARQQTTAAQNELNDIAAEVEAAQQVETDIGNEIAETDIPTPEQTEQYTRAKNKVAEAQRRQSQKQAEVDALLEQERQLQDDVDAKTKQIADAAKAKAKADVDAARAEAKFKLYQEKKNEIAKLENYYLAKQSDIINDAANTALTDRNGNELQDDEGNTIAVQPWYITAAVEAFEKIDKAGLQEYVEAKANELSSIADVIRRTWQDFTVSWSKAGKVDVDENSKTITLPIGGTIRDIVREMTAAEIGKMAQQTNDLTYNRFLEALAKADGDPDFSGFMRSLNEYMQQGMDKAKAAASVVKDRIEKYILGAKEDKAKLKAVLTDDDTFFMQNIPDWINMRNAKLTKALKDAISPEASEFKMDLQLFSWDDDFLLEDDEYTPEELAKEAETQARVEAEYAEAERKRDLVRNIEVDDSVSTIETPAEGEPVVTLNNRRGYKTKIDKVLKGFTPVRNRTATRNSINNFYTRAAETGGIERVMDADGNVTSIRMTSELNEHLDKVAAEYVENDPIENSGKKQEFDSINNYVRNAYVVMTKAERDEIPDFNDYWHSRDNYVKRIVYPKNDPRSRSGASGSAGVPLDIFYKELSEMFPGYFPSDVNPGDQLQTINETLASLDEEAYISVRDAYGEDVYNENIAEVKEKILDGYFSVEDEINGTKASKVDPERVVADIREGNEIPSEVAENLPPVLIDEDGDAALPDGVEMENLPPEAQEIVENVVGEYNATGDEGIIDQYNYAANQGKDIAEEIAQNETAEENLTVDAVDENNDAVEDDDELPFSEPYGKSELDKSVEAREAAHSNTYGDTSNFENSPEVKANWDKEIARLRELYSFSAQGLDKWRYSRMMGSLYTQLNGRKYKGGNKINNTPLNMMRKFTLDLGGNVYENAKYSAEANPTVKDLYDKKSGAIFKGTNYAMDFAAAMYSAAQNIKQRFSNVEFDTGIEGLSFDEFFFDYMTMSDLGLEKFGLLDAANKFKTFMDKYEISYIIDKYRDQLRGYIYALNDEMRSRLFIRQYGEKLADPDHPSLYGKAEKLRTELIDGNNAARFVDRIINEQNKALYGDKAETTDALELVTYRRSYVEKGFETWINGDCVDLNGNATGAKSWRDIIKGNKLKPRDYEDFVAYHTLVEVLDRMKAGKNPFASENVVQTSADTTAEWFEMESPLDNTTKKSLEGYIGLAPTQEKVENAIAELGKKHKTFKNANNEWVTTWDSFMRNCVVKEGLMTEEVYERLHKAHPHYAPLNRKEGGFGVYAAKGGSNEQIVDPIATETLKLKSWFQQGANNRVRQTFDKLFMENDHLGFLAEAVTEDDIKNKGLTKPTGDMVVEVKRNDGSKVWYTIKDKELFDLLSHNDTGKNQKLLRNMSKWTRFMSAAVTSASPIFGLFRNPMKDIGSAINHGSWASTMLTAIPKWLATMGDVALEHTFGKGSQAIKDYLNMGGFGYTKMGDSVKIINDYRSEVWGTKTLFQKGTAPIRYALKPVQTMMDIIETTTRAAEYIYGKHNTGTAQGEAGKIAQFLNLGNKWLGQLTNGKIGALQEDYTQSSKEHAFMESREVTVDFSRKGNSDTMRVLSSIIPFINPTIQGMDRTWRQFTHKEQRGRLAVRMTKTLFNYGVTAIATVALNMGVIGGGSDEDKKKQAEEYLNLDDDLKNLHIIFPWHTEGAREWWRVPISQDSFDAIVYSWFRHGAEGYFMDKYYGSKVNDIYREPLFKYMLGVVADNTVSQITDMNFTFSPIMNVLQNKSWYGDELVTSSYETGSAPSRFYSTTPDVFKDVSMAINKAWEWLGFDPMDENFARLTSPIALKYLLEQYGGFIGTAVSNILTPNPETKKLDLDYAWYNLAKQWRNALTLDSESNSDISDYWDDIEKKLAAVNTDAKRGIYWMVDPTLSEDEKKDAANQIYADLYKRGGDLYKKQQERYALWGIGRSIRSVPFDRPLSEDNAALLNNITGTTNYSAGMNITQDQLDVLYEDYSQKPEIELLKDCINYYNENYATQYFGANKAASILVASAEASDMMDTVDAELTAAEKTGQFNMDDVAPANPVTGEALDETTVSSVTSVTSVSNTETAPTAETTSAPTGDTISVPRNNSPYVPENTSVPNQFYGQNTPVQNGAQTPDFAVDNYTAPTSQPSETQSVVGENDLRAQSANSDIFDARNNDWQYDDEGRAYITDLRNGERVYRAELERQMYEAGQRDASRREEQRTAVTPAVSLPSTTATNSAYRESLSKSFYADYDNNEPYMKVLSQLAEENKTSRGKYSTSFAPKVDYSFYTKTNGVKTNYYVEEYEAKYPGIMAQYEQVFNNYYLNGSTYHGKYYDSHNKGAKELFTDEWYAAYQRATGERKEDMLQEAKYVQSNARKAAQEWFIEWTKTHPI